MRLALFSVPKRVPLGLLAQKSAKLSAGKGKNRKCLKKRAIWLMLVMPRHTGNYPNNKKND